MLVRHQLDKKEWITKKKRNISREWSENKPWNLNKISNMIHMIQMYFDFRYFYLKHDDLSKRNLAVK